MASFFDYLHWRGDLPWWAADFNEVDNLLLCRFAYFPLDGIVSGDFDAPVTIAEAQRRFAARGDIDKNTILHKDDLPFFEALAGSARFGALEVAGYVNRIDFADRKQFSVVSVRLDEKRLFIAFRGTDNTIAGWQEDFNMGYMQTIPSQLDALDYLETAAAQMPEAEILLGGHSKGGNLAVYAATNCPEALQKRISAVYNNDGPGFVSSILSSEAYLRIRDRVHVFVPQSSVVGMLLDHEEEYSIIRSNGKGILQHDPYSWELSRDSFVHLEKVTSSSEFVNLTLKDWIAGMDEAQRAQFANGLFSILGSTNARRLGDLSEDWPQKLGTMIGALRTVDAPTKKALSSTISALFQSAIRNILPGRNAAEEQGGEE